MKRNLAIALLAAILGLGLAACERDGPMENAGETADEAAENAAETAEDAGESMKNTTEKAKENAEEMTNDLSSGN